MLSTTKIKLMKERTYNGLVTYATAASIGLAVLLVPWITHNEPAPSKNACITVHLSLNKLESHTLCGTVTEL